MEGNKFDCMICLSVVTCSRQCMRCRALFCGSCIEKWLSSAVSSPSCPACRLEGDLNKFPRSDLQKLADAINVKCEYNCGKLVPWGQRHQHLQVCVEANVPCPYPGCNFSGPRPEMESHALKCIFSKGYSLGKLLAQRAEMREQDIASADEMSAVLLKQFEQQCRKPEASEDGETIIHYVLPCDTLSGIAVRYNTSKSAIQRLNSFAGDLIHGFSSLVVPRPANFTQEKEVVPPAEVLVALQKKKQVNDMMRLAQIQSEEALTYLLLNKFDLAAATAQHKDDCRWGESNPHRFRPRTLKQFRKALEKRRSRMLNNAPTNGCHGCVRPLSDETAHCKRCGKIFCGTCVEGGEISRRLAKRVLGVTCPDTQYDLVPVCSSCFCD